MSGTWERSTGIWAKKLHFFNKKKEFLLEYQMKIYPNIIENTEVNFKALVEAVVLTEEVETKVGAACCQHHRCCRGHRRLVVHQHRLSGLLGFEICPLAIFNRQATCNANRVSNLSSSISHIAGHTLYEKNGYKKVVAGTIYQIDQ